MHSHLARAFPLLALLACSSAPTAPPVRFRAADVEGSNTTSWCAHFDLLDATGDITTSPGSLVYAIRGATGNELCRVVATAPGPVYDQTTWRATLCTTVPHTTCPPLATPDERRVAVLTFTPPGAAPIVSDALVTASARMFRPPSEPTPPPPAPPPIEPTPPAPPATAGEEDGWIVVPALGARVHAPGARSVPARQPPLGASDVHIVGASDDCRVQLARYPTILVSGTSTRARVTADGNVLTVDEIAADRWHLEYEANSYLYVSVGAIVGDAAIVCRADYPSGQAQSLACAAEICTSLRLDAPSAPPPIP